MQPKKRNKLNPNWRDEFAQIVGSMFVEKFEYSGSLLTSNATRASFNTEKKKFDIERDAKLIRFCAREEHKNPFYHRRLAVKIKNGLKPTCFLDRHESAGFDFDPETNILTFNVYNCPEFFINYFGGLNCEDAYALLESGHRGLVLDPDSVEKVYEKLDAQHPCAWHHLRFSAPIPILRQWMKSKIGADESEESRRYIMGEPTFYLIPADQLRRAPMDGENIKQGSSAVPFTVEEAEEIFKICEESINSSRNYYNTLLEKGLCAEQARFHLIQAAMPTVVQTVTTKTLMRLSKLRSAHDAQKEIAIFMDMVSNVTGVKYVSN